MIGQIRTPRVAFRTWEAVAILGLTKMRTAPYDSIKSAERAARKHLDSLYREADALEKEIRADG